jgi:hypothetical protein
MAHCAAPGRWACLRLTFLWQVWQLGVCMRARAPSIHPHTLVLERVRVCVCVRVRTCVRA